MQHSTVKVLIKQKRIAAYKELFKVKKNGVFRFGISFLVCIMQMRNVMTS